jgi:hypothetical protein
MRTVGSCKNVAVEVTPADNWVVGIKFENGRELGFEKLNDIVIDTGGVEREVNIAHDEAEPGQTHTNAEEVILVAQLREGRGTEVTVVEVRR